MCQGCSLLIVGCCRIKKKPFNGLQGFSVPPESALPVVLCPVFLLLLLSDLQEAQQTSDYEAFGLYVARTFPQKGVLRVFVLIFGQRDKGRIWNLQTEEPLPLGSRTWSLEIIQRTLIKIQNTRHQFARACVEKLEERVRLSDPRQRTELRSSFHYHLCE